MQIMGGAGYLRNAVERIYREVKVQAIGGGSEEIMRDLSVRLMGLKRASNPICAKARTRPHLVRQVLQPARFKRG